MDWKRENIIDNVESPLNDNEVPTTKQETLDDEQPLVFRKANEALKSKPVVMQKSVAAWAVGGFGALFLLVALLIVQISSRYVSRGSETNGDVEQWTKMLPRDVASHIDPEVDPCDDFYAFSCGSWLKHVTIPGDKPSVSLSFSIVQDENEKLLSGVMQQGWPLLSELYDSCMNFTNTSSPMADVASLNFISPVLTQIAATKTKMELFHLAGVISKEGPNMLTDLRVASDSRNATVYALYASQTGLSLPDREYYTDREKFDSISHAFHAYVEKLFLLAGWESHAAASQASTVIDFEKTIALNFVPKEKLRDPISSYNRMSVAEAASEYPLLFSQFLNGTGLLSNLTAHNADVIVQTPEFFSRTEMLVSGSSVTLETLQAVLAYRYIGSYSSILSEPFIQASFSFFGQTLNGQKTRSPRWKVCLRIVTNNFPDLVGKYFALLRFDNATAQLASELVTDVQSSLQTGLGQVDWLDKPTRQKALEKLGMMTNLVGYSTRSKHYPFELRSDAPLADNIQIIKKYGFDEAAARIGRPVDRNEWSMSGAAVNAYYQPTANQIVFPAAILQPPFFAIGRHSARNFGAIGTIVGHELSHGFDDQGRNYAGDGNLQSWWSNDTAQQFLQRTDCLVKQYDSYAVTSETDKDKVLGYVNGNYTLGENIADNGGVKLSFTAYQTYIAEQAQELSKKSEAEVTELTTLMSQSERNLPPDVADKLFFISFAQTFCEKKSDTSVIQSLATDPHSLGRWRINGAVSNSPDFTRVFSCPAGSRMNPKTKCQLW